MNWSVPAPASIQNRETFENYDNWTINQFGDWTTYSSIKSGETGGLWGSQGMPFPHENELYNYIVLTRKLSRKVSLRRTSLSSLTAARSV